MAVSPSRAAAFDTLLKVDRERAYASELLHSARSAKLSSADHGLANEIVMGVLRWRSLLDQRLAGASSQKIERLDAEVLTALRMGLYQLQFLSRVPARAAIFESVELVKQARKRSAASFVNAVLRKLAQGSADKAAGPAAQQRAAIRSSPDPIALARNSAHPEWLVERWSGSYGLESARKICEHNQSVPVSTIRLNDEEALAELTQSGTQLAPGSLLSAAHIVLAGDVTQTNAFQQDRIAIQDEASQLVALLVGRGERILDCCAAPGGKTSLIASRNPHSKILATELHPHRARLLRNLVRQPNICVVASDARQLPFSKQFDRILADVPCSGTGTFAHNPEIKWRLSPQDLIDLQSRQVDILKSALGQLSQGGRLVYSTCSLEREENEDVIKAALSGTSQFSIFECRGELERMRQSGELSIDDLSSIIAGPHLRTIPGALSCDGFFAAIIERKT
jgi:16S rRNA (cytosine967-C5)-methyltransferase